MVKKLISCISVFLGALIFLSTADAQLLIEKSRVELDVTPGETISDSMVLHNQGGTPLSVKVYWQDFHYLEPYRGKKDFLPAGTSPYTMHTWITFSPQELILPGKSKRRVDFTIKVPDDATGGHYGVLFFEQGDVRPMGATGVNIVTRLGALFFVDSLERDKTLITEDLRVSGNQFSGMMKNSGDLYLFPKGQYYVMDAEGLVIDRGKLDKIYLPPQAKTEYSFEVGRLDEGSYTLILTFDLDDGDSLTQEVDFELAANGRFKIRAQRN